MSDVAYVSKGFIEPSPPPSTAAGPVAWLRENLFAGPVNTILTLVSLALLALLIPGIVQWAFVDATWVASSLSECREIGEGACWAVINERLPQFTYGFYPAELRWRPNLAFLLLLVAVAYALFDGLPGRRWGLMFAGAYPVIAYFLIWGGPFWPIVSFAVFAAGIWWGGGAVRQAVARALDTDGEDQRVGFAVLGAGALFTLLWWLAVHPATFGGLSESMPGFGLESVESRDLGGFLLAIIIGVAGIVLSLPIGILLALGRRSGLIFIQTLSIVFIEFVRGVPLITLLFVANSVLAYFFPPGSNLDLILRVVIMVTMFASAYMAEVIRGGLAALPPGQYEAADSLGLDYWKSMRLIILPQALKISIPNIVSTFIGLFKDTTLVVVIGLLDPIGLITTIRADSAWNGLVWEFYIFVGAVFFVACYAMSRYAAYLERKLKTDR